MGPRHDDSLLTQVVTEPYLSTVRKDASSARKAGWFWSYRLSDLYVRSVCIPPHFSVCDSYIKNRAGHGSLSSQASSAKEAAVLLKSLTTSAAIPETACDSAGLHLATERDVWPQRFAAQTFMVENDIYYRGDDCARLDVPPSFSRCHGSL